MNVALLGTGTMGAGMARSLRRAGLDVTVWNRTAAKAQLLAADGVAVAGTVGEAVTGAEAVLTMLFDADAVLAVADELLDALAPGAVWLQSATVGVEGIARIAERAGDAALLDAPMLGTKQPAEEGRLVPIVSGDPGLVARVKPILDAVGTRTVVAGDRIGEATAVKLACNAWILSITAALGQSVALARALGVEPALFLDAVGGGPTDSPYAQLKAKLMLDGDFAPAFSVDGGRKDLALIAAAAASVGVRETLLDEVRELYDEAGEKGHSAEDIAAVYTAFMRA